MPVRGARLYLRWLALDNNDRVAAMAGVSVAIGATTALVKFGLGIWAMSVLFLVSGAYYAVLCAARFMVVRSHRRTRLLGESTARASRGTRVYRRTGAFLCLTGLTYAAFCVVMLFDDRQQRTNMTVAITVATITTVKISGAIRGVIVARRTHDPIDSSVKFISFVDALLSLVATQNVILLSEGSAHATLSSALFGMGLGAVVMVLGVWMVARRNPPQAIAAPRSTAAPTPQPNPEPEPNPEPNPDHTTR